MLFSKETFRAHAQSRGIDIDDDALVVLARDLEYRVKELCQEANKFMVFSHRTKLTVEDINSALISRNVDPLFGYNPQDTLVFQNLSANIFYIPDEEIDIEECLNQPLPKMPLKPSISTHWLAIEGVQPQIPQNPLPTDQQSNKRDPVSTLQSDVEIQPSLRHVLSKELQTYYEKIITYITSSDPEENELGISCLKNESGMQQLIPYFIQYFNENVIKNLKDTNNLKIFISSYRALLENKYIFIDPYLHQIIPSLLTCVVGKSVTDLSLRKYAGDNIKYIYDNFSKSYVTLAPRIINTLKKAWLDKEKSEESQYGAIYCLTSMPKTSVEKVIRDNYEEYKNFYKNNSVTSMIEDFLNESNK
ncbi:Transcription initiation factor TFIID 70 kDa subunit [Spraguea lophii 42_110]|uniref:Transcription initiation factor TFIID 70 kDa subunit n=1 Tax=Spraguea lophii (strain 42_110) TaxID=1358809 RepID=S7XV47_SPRLO|nr:Transcription initiation factor TFIID 70 kDa subunit [Spraguea lophii 42_110]